MLLFTRLVSKFKKEERCDQLRGRETVPDPPRRASTPPAPAKSAAPSAGSCARTRRPLVRAGRRGRGGCAGEGGRRARRGRWRREGAGSRRACPGRGRGGAIRQRG